jgi:3-oxoacyl-[acyl-carrier protein] reductase
MTNVKRAIVGMEATNDRVAVVTGGAHGIGEAVVRRFAGGMGLTTIIGDLDEVAANGLAIELVRQGSRAHAMKLDVGSSESISEFFAKLSAEFGRCDVLVNNAGIARIAPFAEVTLEDWNAHLAVNVTGALLMSQKAVPFMIRANWGRIVKVTSISGIRASVGRTAYGTSKGALSALTRQMAVEFATSCITVNAVAPGPVETAMAQELHSTEMRELYNSMVPMARYVTPSEVAGAIAFLCSDDATYVTGHTLLVDGGYVAGGLLRY